MFFSCHICFECLGLGLGSGFALLSISGGQSPRDQVHHHFLFSFHIHVQSVLVCIDRIFSRLTIDWDRDRDRDCFPLQEAKRRGTKFDLPLIGEIDLTFTWTELASLTVGIAFSAVYTMTRHWALNNIFGMTFCVQVGVTTARVVLAWLVVMVVVVVLVFVLAGGVGGVLKVVVAAVLLRLLFGNNMSLVLTRKY